MSHGQASVEWGFSVNKEIATSNLMEHNLIARRVIKAHVQSVGGLKQLLISKELLQSAQNARHQYHAHLESQKAQKEAGKRCQTNTCGRKQWKFEEKDDANRVQYQFVID